MQILLAAPDSDAACHIVRLPPFVSQRPLREPATVTGANRVNSFLSCRGSELIITVVVVLSRSGLGRCRRSYRANPLGLTCKARSTQTSGSQGAEYRNLKLDHRLVRSYVQICCVTCSVVFLPEGWGCTS